MLLVALSGLQPPAEGAARAAGAGLTVAALVHCFVGVSGAQLNPAVTLAALVWGRAAWRRAALEWAAQLLGAVAGAAALRLLAASDAVTAPAPGVGAARALALEAAAAAVLALANCAAWAEPRPPDAWPLRIGTTVAALTLVTLDSGASMNPARSFGPALVAGAWRAHWVYWAGPLGGAAAAAALHRVVWYVPPRRSQLASSGAGAGAGAAVEMQKPAEASYSA